MMDSEKYYKDQLDKKDIRIWELEMEIARLKKLLTQEFFKKLMGSRMAMESAA